MESWQAKHCQRCVKVPEIRYEHCLGHSLQQIRCTEDPCGHAHRDGSSLPRSHHIIRRVAHMVRDSAITCKQALTTVCPLSALRACC